jgi:hypothetical protein
MAIVMSAAADPLRADLTVPDVAKRAASLIAPSAVGTALSWTKASSLP